MKAVIGIAVAVLGVLVAFISPFLAFSGAMWDWIALISGDVISGPELAARFPDAAFLLGIPLGTAMIVVGWLIVRPPRSERLPPSSP